MVFSRALTSFCGLAVATAAAALASTPARPDVQILQPVAFLPSHLASTLRDPIACLETPSGEQLILDRRGHALFAVNTARTSLRRVLSFGEEAGGIAESNALAGGPNGTFAIADAPKGFDRVQWFSAEGKLLGFLDLSDKLVQPKIPGPTLSQTAGVMQFTGDRFFFALPGRGSLVSEVDLKGRTTRQIGRTRPTGQEQDPELHTALNTGFPLIDSSGNLYYVFQAGMPMFRKYDAAGKLVFERHIEGVEIDRAIEELPAVWPVRSPGDGTHPVVPALVRAAGIDRRGQLWISLSEPFTYIYDARGDKIRTVQFNAGTTVSPVSLSFTSTDHVLIAPGCYEYDAR